MSCAAALFVFLALVVTALAPGAAALKTCYMLFGPLSDLGYSFAHNLARTEAHRRLLAERPALELSSRYVESAFFAPDRGAQVVQGFVDEGCAVVHATAPGFADAVRPFVARYPNVTFSLQNAFNAPSWQPANLVAYGSRSYRQWYVAGVAAGSHSVTGAVGFVAAHTDIPEVAAAVAAFNVGVHRSNPSAQVHVLEVGSWFDPETDRSAARELHEVLDCDVVAHFGDSNAVAAYAAAVEKEPRAPRFFAVPMHTQANLFSGDAVLTCVHSDWSGVYHAINARRAGGLAATQAGMWSPSVPRLCTVSPRADAATFAAVRRANVSDNPFDGWSDAALRALSLKDGRAPRELTAGLTDHGRALAPASCRPGTVVVCRVDRGNASLACACTPCLAGAFATDGQQCQPCAAGLTSAAGAAICAPPAATAALTGAALAGVAVAVAALVLITAAGVAVGVRRRYRRAAADRAGAHRAAANMPKSGAAATVVAFGVADAAGFWEADAGLMRAFVERYLAEVRAATAAHRGFEASGEAESVLVVADAPATGVALAVAAMRAVQDIPAPYLFDGATKPAVSVTIVHGAVAVETATPPRPPGGAHHHSDGSSSAHAQPYFSASGAAVDAALALQVVAEPGELLAEADTAGWAVVNLPLGTCSLGPRRRRHLLGDAGPDCAVTATRRLEVPGIPRPSYSTKYAYDE